MSDPALRDRTDDIQALLEAGRSGRAGLRRWGILAAALAAATLLAALLLVWRGGGSDGGIRFRTEPVTRGDLRVVVVATGSLQPTNQVEVSSELSGTVRKVFVDYNSAVAAGDRLAEMDTEKLVAVVENSRAKLEAAEARARVAEVTVAETGSDYQRKKALADRSYASTHELEIAQALYHRAVATLASARADIAVARADLRLNETNLAKACICSPIGGVVLKRNIDPGQTVAASFQAPVLFAIAEDLTKMEVQVDVDEADVGKVKAGQSASFTVDAYPDRAFRASVEEVRFASEIVQGVVTYKATLAVDNSELLLRPGMTATAEIAVQEVKNALLVPNAALRFTPPAQAPAGGEVPLLRRILPGPPHFRAASPREETGSSRRAWILENGQPVEVPVSVGASDGRTTQVLEGALREGQPVIVDGATVRR